MKAPLSFLIFFVFLFPFVSTAQNLIPDPGFEVMQKVPSQEDNGIRCTGNWVNAVLTNGDYYNRVAGSKLLGVGVPRNRFGHQQPHAGNGYAGICIQKDMMEYVETKLTARLIKGKTYLIEFYICKAEHRFGHVNEFGVLFTNKLQWSYPKTGVPIKPPIDFVNPDGYRDTKRWTKLSATYVAEGFETVFILGHFNYGQPMKGKAHYYIDDVTITPVNDETADAVNAEEIPVSDPQLKDSIRQTFVPVIGKAVTLKNIFFESNKSELLRASFEELDKLADYLIKSGNTFIEINGHTDNTGNEQENKRLSEARAKAVAEYLTLKGINKKRINYNGYGSLKPIATNDTDDGKQQNRRVEFIIRN